MNACSDVSQRAFEHLWLSNLLSTPDPHIQKNYSQLFRRSSSAYLCVVIGFLVKYCLNPQQHSLLIFARLKQNREMRQKKLPHGCFYLIFPLYRTQCIHQSSHILMYLCKATTLLLSVAPNLCMLLIAECIYLKPLPQGRLCSACWLSANFKIDSSLQCYSYHPHAVHAQSVCVHRHLTPLHGPPSCNMIVRSY